MINSKCAACGHAFTVDPKHKVTTFILKNPPPVDAADESSKLFCCRCFGVWNFHSLATYLEDKREASPTDELGLNGVEADANGKPVPKKEDEADDDDDWAPEPLTDQEKLSAQVGKLVIDQDLEKPMEERLDMLHRYFLAAKKRDAIGDGKDLLNEAERLELKTRAPVLLTDMLLTKNAVQDLKTHRMVFLRFCNNDKKAQRYMLHGIEQFIAANEDLLPRAAHIVKALYDNDICEEEAILAWGAKVGGRALSVARTSTILPRF